MNFYADVTAGKVYLVSQSFKLRNDGSVELQKLLERKMKWRTKNAQSITDNFLCHGR
jgi:hypothetical protein